MLKRMILVLAFAFANAAAAVPGCSSASALDDTIDCLREEVIKAEADMGRYLDASKGRHAGNRLQLRAIDASQQTWQNVRRLRCSAVNVLPRDDKKHMAELLSCRVRELRERTHRIWESYLTYPDGRQPDLPEPAQ